MECIYVCGKTTNKDVMQDTIIAVTDKPIEIASFQLIILSPTN